MRSGLAVTGVVLLLLVTSVNSLFPLMDCIAECFLCPQHTHKGLKDMETCAMWCIVTAGRSRGSGCEELTTDWANNNDIPENLVESPDLSSNGEIVEKREKRQVESESTDAQAEQEITVPKTNQNDEVVPEHAADNSLHGEVVPAYPIQRGSGRSTHLLRRGKRVDLYTICLEQCVQCVFLYGYGTYDGTSCAQSCVVSGGFSADPNCENENFYIRFKK